MNEKTSRSIIKTITWRVLGSSSVVICTYIATDDINTALMTAASTFVVNAFLYFIHERVWSKIKWGYKKVEETSFVVDTCI